jgi:hypothetical protein
VHVSKKGIPHTNTSGGFRRISEASYNHLLVSYKEHNCRTRKELKADTTLELDTCGKWLVTAKYNGDI